MRKHTIISIHANSLQVKKTFYFARIVTTFFAVSFFPLNSEPVSWDSRLIKEITSVGDLNAEGVLIELHCVVEGPADAASAAIWRSV
ncbi:hypothetical protein AYI68_g6636 [Smittium mucronatum]|uniref:Uncharacterized protein n=1 Tax=Smittium mucronatum TaxID=133383 RepID=A0A1R0GQX5_9FUNG|nr:hypothetical protein AYI68_g6636 [Smittium mucronatum]